MKAIKSLFIFLTVSFFLSHFGCLPQSSENNLVGRWEFMEFDLKALEEKAGQQMDEREMMQMKFAESLFKMAQYQFFKDKTYTLGVEGKEAFAERGTYNLENDGTFLVLQQDNAGGNNNNNKNNGRKLCKILSLEGDKMVLEIDNLICKYSKIKEK
jgi:hypothetical protein